MSEAKTHLGKVEAADEIRGGNEGLVLDVETCGSYLGQLEGTAAAAAGSYVPATTGSMK